MGSIGMTELIQCTNLENLQILPRFFFVRIAALLSRVTRSAQLEIHNAIMPAIFDEIHTMEELDTIVLYVNSSTPSRVRRGRMQQFVDLCRARILS
jgi:hypothetical protein